MAMWYGMISGVAGLIFRRETHVDALPFEFADFFLQRGRRQHDAIADQAQHAFAQDAGRDQVQHRLLALDDERVAGVVAALETRDGADAFGQQIDDLAFAFVAPLRAENDDRLTHDFFRRCRSFSVRGIAIDPLPGTFGRSRYANQFVRTSFQLTSFNAITPSTIITPPIVRSCFGSS